jgi:hypothetical protein
MLRVFRLPRITSIRPDSNSAVAQLDIAFQFAVEIDGLAFPGKFAVDHINFPLCVTSVQELSTDRGVRNLRTGFCDGTLCTGGTTLGVPVCGGFPETSVEEINSLSLLS